MFAAIRFYDVVLWIHITAVVAAFGALFAYPIFLAVNARAPLAQRAGFHQAQIAFSKRVTGPVIGVILLAGIYLATDAELWDEAWVGISLAAAVRHRRARGDRAAARRGARSSRPSEGGDEAAYAATLATARTWTFVTLALIVVTIFFMSVKPF